MGRQLFRVFVLKNYIHNFILSSPKRHCTVQRSVKPLCYAPDFSQFPDDPLNGGLFVN